MKIETKYNFGDKVWEISPEPKQIWLTCSFCNGLGEITGKDNKTRSCPECYDRKGRYISKNIGWRIREELTIGEVEVTIVGEDPVGTPGHEQFSNYGPQKAKYEEVYMCKETGIGSGSLHDVSTLWPTKEKAEAECERKNET